MAYKYLPIIPSLTPGSATDPKQQYIELFEATLNEQFYNASNWWRVEEESSIGSNIFSTIDVRVAHLINAETGLKLGDDWKTIYFKEIGHSIELGRYYKFDSNTWLTVNSEIIKNLVGGCTVRRCNNTLRWVDEATGAYYEEPCAIEYLVKEPRNYATAGSPFMTPGGFLHIQTQLNERTTKIKENQRFLFGNQNHWTCYKIIGTGINDFRNMQTYENTSANVLTLDLTADFVNDVLDDVVNGYADANTNVYTITLNQSTAEGSVGDTIQLIASVTYNEDTVSRTITWASSDSDIATVDTNGLVTLISNGTCSISANIELNPVSDSCAITVTPTPAINYDVYVTPDTNYVLEGTSREYTVYLYEDGVQQADAFTITCNGNTVPSTSYTFTQTDGNHFTISNIEKDVNSYLTVQLTSGLHVENFDVYLRGKW